MSDTQVEKKLLEATIITPELGTGVLPPNTKIEKYFNLFVSKLPIFSAILLILVALAITRDILGRLFFNNPFEGVTDYESLGMTIIGFSAMAYAVVSREAMQIDLFYNNFRSPVQRNLNLLANLTCTVITMIIGYRAILSSLDWSRSTPLLDIAEWPFVMVTGIALFLSGIAFMFQSWHSIKDMLAKKEIGGIVIAIVITIILMMLPYLYRMYGTSISPFAIGVMGFALLMILMLLRIPLGFAMCIAGFIGMLALSRRTEAAFMNVGSIPFLNTTDFTMIAFPMFMLMGSMTFRSGLSDDLFNVANKWFGKLPGGLAVASVGGCAGFGAVCGDSLATVITMTSVALPPMRANNYDDALSTGALAAGGTLGILIPPSMGFIIYSMITEESVGKLFVAGILPGILLAAIFIGIIVIQVKRNPALAPPSATFTLAEKLGSLVLLIPVIILFGVIVGGILYGFFTPAEGGAIGAVMATLYAFARKKMDLRIFWETMLSSAALFGKFFSLFVGLYVFGGFLAASRLPNLLSEFIVGMEVNRYMVLATIILIYIVLGCVMNILPMMMLTLPSIYPTVQALGFDGIWFGVICVIVMEMGMITPPVGMNVFTLSSLVPDIPMSKMFRGVMPFFIGMLLCVFLIIIFPDIALILTRGM